MISKQMERKYKKKNFFSFFTVAGVLNFTFYFYEFLFILKYFIFRLFIIEIIDCMS